MVEDSKVPLGHLMTMLPAEDWMLMVTGGRLVTTESKLLPFWPAK